MEYEHFKPVPVHINVDVLGARHQSTNVLSLKIHVHVSFTLG